MSDHSDALEHHSAMRAGAALMAPGAATAGTGAMALRDYLRHDAMGLAALVKSGEVSPAELMEIAIAQAEAVNPLINAVTLQHYDLGRQAALQVDKNTPLAGVPFLLKDLNIQLAGTITTNGSRFHAERVATYSSTLTQRYQAAGLNIFGKTASPEMGKTVTTESRLHGQTRNPWNLEYSSGGSSGGASAAVAAGIVPAAHATDGGGSIRIPAALCGLVGLKPTRARTPLGPGKSEGWAGLSCAHVVSRSLRDSALLLDISQGPEPGAAYWPPSPRESYLGEIGRDPGKLRVALITESPLSTPVDQDCLDALSKAAALCQALGHAVREAHLPASFANLYKSFGAVVTVGFAAAIRQRAVELDREPGPEDLEPVNFINYQWAKQMNSIDYELARQAVQNSSFEMAAFMRDFDVIVSPVSARAPWRLGTVHLDQDAEEFFRRLAGYGDFCSPFNCTGQPSLSLPLHTGATGMPVGVLFSAAYADEKTLFRLAAQIEHASPWFDTVSPLLAQALIA